MYHNFLIHSSANGHLGCFHVPAIVNGTAMNIWTSLGAQTVKHLPTMWETWVQSLGWEDLLEKEMATYSSILARGAW